MEDIQKKDENDHRALNSQKKLPWFPAVQKAMLKITIPDDTLQHCYPLMAVGLATVYSEQRFPMRMESRFRIGMQMIVAEEVRCNCLIRRVVHDEVLPHFQWGLDSVAALLQNDPNALYSGVISRTEAWSRKYCCSHNDPGNNYPAAEE
ncbi:OLC1v1039188C1 [Oldenlandia corymbosa var. corymbosa]|uniref:OLC1v1039188C1 n=1 Tax=Oldenlandia corymbosa var. corymbosa TaxID=529605 RepID=A0AAV1D4K9_OLDCO|nr:OLC1v1039188C1 [Oldenlandia corymbosa var. corymbosa]